MIKQLALVIVLILGIGGTVLVVQKSTLLKSFSYDVLDFVYSFHASEGDPEFNSNLDVYKDGIINVLDILKDRYAQEASRSGTASDSADLSNIIDEFDQLEDSSDSAEDDLESDI